MPYVKCATCAVTVFTAARHSTTDLCPRCGEPLSIGADERRRIELLSTTAAQLRRQRELLDAQSHPSGPALADAELAGRFDDLARQLAERAAGLRRRATRRYPPAA